LHIPAGSNSWHFGAKEFALMKPSACLINTARGGILDLDALAAALGEGRLAGAGLDVFPDEPMNLAHPVFALEQVVVTPHTGGMTKESRYRQLSSCLGECTRVRKRERSPNALNQAVYSLPAWQGDTRRG
jgi:D-3-phosphoglycerate dehydrogenase